MLTIRIQRRHVTRALVAVGFLGAIVVLAQVPNTFSPNTVISSAQVNANFQALNAEKQPLSGFKTAVFNDDIANGTSNLGSLTIDGGGGNYLAMAAGYCNVDATAGLELDIGFSTITNDLLPPVSNWWVYRVGTTSSITAMPLFVANTVPVQYDGGPQTIYLVAINQNSAPNMTCSGNITVQLMPTSL